MQVSSIAEGLICAPVLREASTPVVFALNAREQDLFFARVRGGLPEELASISRWAEAEDFASLGRWREFLRTWQPQVLVTCWSTPPLPLDWIAEENCPLRYVCHVTGSVRGVVPRAFLERGGRVTNWGGMAARQVAEHALLLALASLRKQPEWRDVPWVEGGMPTGALLGTRTLFGRSIGLHGFGAVACALLDLLKAFDVTVHAYSAGVPAALMHKRNVEPCGSLAELFARSEVLFECEALTPETAGSVSAEVLAALPDGGVFINVGRGQVVQEPALVQEAASGRILVAVDVVAEEPPSPDSELANLPEIILSPHIAGPTYDQLPRCGELALKNIGRFLADEALEAEVSLEIYDRTT